jgi:hypothetical protein
MVTPIWIFQIVVVQEIMKFICVEGPTPRCGEVGYNQCVSWACVLWSSTMSGSHHVYKLSLTWFSKFCFQSLCFTLLCLYVLLVFVFLFSATLECPGTIFGTYVKSLTLVYIHPCHRCLDFHLWVIIEEEVVSGLWSLDLKQGWAETHDTIALMISGVR